jgi:hypothetical protein
LRTLRKCMTIFVLGILGVASIQCQEKMFVMTIHALSPDGGIAKSGQNVVLEVRMLNNSQRILTISEGNPTEDYVVQILDSSGLRPADTDYSLKLKKSAASPGKILDANRSISFQLKPGETGTDVIPISMMYDMRVPGKYSVKVERSLPRELGAGVVRSNAVTITVTE